MSRKSCSTKWGLLIYRYTFCCEAMMGTNNTHVKGDNLSQSVTAWNIYWPPMPTTENFNKCINSFTMIVPTCLGIFIDNFYCNLTNTKSCVQQILAKRYPDALHLALYPVFCGVGPGHCSVGSLLISACVRPIQGRLPYLFMLHNPKHWFWLQLSTDPGSPCSSVPHHSPMAERCFNWEDVWCHSVISSYSITVANGYRFMMQDFLLKQTDLPWMTNHFFWVLVLYKYTVDILMHETVKVFV